MVSSVAAHAACLVIRRTTLSHLDSGTLDCMDPAKASATAVGVAVARGAHRSYDQPPWVLDDPFALQLAGPQWAEIQAASEAALPGAAVRQNRASIVARSRYAEDRLISGGYR